MSKKISFSEFPEFQTKVKKEKPKKDVSPVSEATQDKRHEKINFKQYLRGLEENQGLDDEFADIPVLAESQLIRERDMDRSGLYGGDTRAIQFDGDDGMLTIAEDDWQAIKQLEKDDSIVILDSYDDRWHVSRSLLNMIVFESQEYVLSGKFYFDDFIKKLK
jgi:hypothetical protein